MADSTSNVLSVADDGEFYQETYTKLQMFQTGAKNSAKTRVISYVQPNNTPRGPTQDLSRNVSDLVILDEYDEDGNLQKKGTVIIRGARKELQTLDSTTNPMDKKKANRVQMQFQIVEPKKRFRTKPTKSLPKSTEEAATSAELAKPLQINSPSTRTRTEAAAWVEVHRKDDDPKWVHPSPNKPIPHASSKSPNPKLAIKAFESFAGNDSFAERDGMPMSARRGLTDQRPDSARVRRDPTANNDENLKPRAAHRLRAMYEPFPSRRTRDPQLANRRDSAPAAISPPKPTPPTPPSGRRLDYPFARQIEVPLSARILSDEETAELSKNLDKIGSMFKHVRVAKDSGRITDQQYHSAVAELEKRSKKNAEVVFSEELLPIERPTEVSSTRLTGRRSSLADYSVGLHFDEASFTPKTPRRPLSARMRGNNDAQASPGQNRRLLKGHSPHRPSNSPGGPLTAPSPRAKPQSKAFADVLFPYKNAGHRVTDAEPATPKASPNRNQIRRELKEEFTLNSPPKRAVPPRQI